MLAILGRFLGIVAGCAVVLLIVGAGPLVWVYDRQPVRPAWTQAHFLWWHLPAFISDPSLAAQLDHARADYLSERVTFQVEHDAFTAENAAVLSIATSSDRWQAASRASEAQAARSNAWREALARKIMSPAPSNLSPSELCSAAEAVLRGNAQ